MKETLERPVVPANPAFRAVFERFVRRRRALLVGLAIAFPVLAIARARDGADQGTLDASLAAVLARDGIEVDTRSVVFLAEGGGALEALPTLFRARRQGEPHDIWFAEVRPSGGAALDVSWVTNVTRTSSADEEAPVRLGRFVAYASRVGDAYDAVSVIDAAGEPASVTRGWSLAARAQNAITNLQETGQRDGLGRCRYRLTEPARSVSIAAEHGRYVVVADGARIVIDPDEADVLDGAEHVEVAAQTKGVPGTITWVVDTVRNVSWIGPEPIEWLEHRVFGVKDALERAWYAVFDADTEAEVAEDLGVSEAERRRRLELSVTDPELGWPPRALERVLGNRVEGEGEWIAVVDDPFVASYPGAPPAFFQTFVRADPERAYTRVYVTIWDPRQVQLHIVSGTNEPESATGETGTGMAPRDPEVLTRLVGGFNGGFQALHGEFGMMADGRVYLPPKPWAASVAVYRDGRVALGSWMPPPPGARVFEEGWAVAQIPEDMAELRQNLTSVVEDDRYNPWGRWWWGAAPVNADEQSFIDRTGLCLTEEGFLAYYWGESMGPEALGRAMIATRCVRGLHLDMNSRHTGFELYRIVPRSVGFPPLGRPLDDESEYEGPVPLADNFLLRARKMVRRMSTMNFPRYAGRDGRDFFYLTLRPTLPGPAIGEAPNTEDAPGVFTSAGLPHSGWPYAFARAHLGEGAGARTWLVRIDPARALPASLAWRAGAPLAYISGARALARADAPFALYSMREHVGRRWAIGAPPEGADVVIAGAPLADSPNAEAAIGIDADGFLLYAERQPSDPAPLRQRLREAGVTRAVALPDGVALAFAVDGTTVAPDAYERPLDPELALSLVAEERPYTEVLFPDTEPLPYARWWRMQDARVRYFREGPPTFVREGGGLRIVPDAGTPPP